jgi:hypothetical protein
MTRCQAFEEWTIAHCHTDCVRGRPLSGRSPTDIHKSNEATVVSWRPADFSGDVAPYAIAPENAERLWDVAWRAVS